MGKNIVICCDGTGNEIGTTTSNVLKLYRILEKNEQQRVYYNPGVGTIGLQNPWQRFKQKANAVFGLATGLGLYDDVLGAYRFLCETYEQHDRIWMFGFSRGAYTVRVLAGFVHVIGLLHPDQLNIAGYAFDAYQRAGADLTGEPPDEDAEPDAAEATPTSSAGLTEAWHFGRVAGGRRAPVEFIGAWDTVASLIVPRAGTLKPILQMLPYTRSNPSVKIFRHAMSIDERRSMFRLNRWKPEQQFHVAPSGAGHSDAGQMDAGQTTMESRIPQDIRQVWFAGVHSDVGGGYPEVESAMSKYPLRWMIDQAVAKGLAVDRTWIDHLVLGRARPGSRHCYVAPDPAGQLHDSMTPAWRILEFLPKRIKWREWPDRPQALGYYLPLSEPRFIPDGALVHRSVLLHREREPSYCPPNLPGTYDVEELSPD